ncbi:putative nucleolar complex protein [Trichinella spiralis]|uniref:Nucleolar complex protein n=1 Tax=Trichinella spiralis TaxID=6334 RepID=A0ABR3K747_TRISP
MLLHFFFSILFLYTYPCLATPIRRIRQLMSADYYQINPTFPSFVLPTNVLPASMHNPAYEASLQTVSMNGLQHMFHTNPQFPNQLLLHPEATSLLRAYGQFDPTDFIMKLKAHHTILQG